MNCSKAEPKNADSIRWDMENVDSTTTLREVDAEVGTFAIISRLQSYFDIDSSEVFHRLISSATTCHVPGGFCREFLNEGTTGADLYSPFWVSTSLVFLVTVSIFCNYAITNWHIILLTHFRP
jgi:hypothetical protein